MTSSPERTPKKTPTVALAIACLSVAIATVVKATVVNTCHIAYSIYVTILIRKFYMKSLIGLSKRRWEVNLKISLREIRSEMRMVQCDEHYEHKVLLDQLQSYYYYYSMALQPMSVLGLLL
jgi:hypothetical protein